MSQVASTSSRPKPGSRLRRAASNSRSPAAVAVSHSVRTSAGSAASDPAAARPPIPRHQDHSWFRAASQRARGPSTGRRLACGPASGPAAVSRAGRSASGGRRPARLRSHSAASSRSPAASSAASRSRAAWLTAGRASGPAGCGARRPAASWGRYPARRPRDSNAAACSIATSSPDLAAPPDSPGPAGRSGSPGPPRPAGSSRLADGNAARPVPSTAAWTSPGQPGAAAPPRASGFIPAIGPLPRPQSRRRRPPGRRPASRSGAGRPRRPARPPGG